AMGRPELIATLFRLVDAGEWHRLDEVFSRDCVYHRPGYPEIHGLLALKDFYRNVRVVGSGRHEVLEVIADEHHGCCWGRFVGVSRSGEPITELFADWYVFAGPVID